MENLQDKRKISIDDIVFQPADENEISIINKYKAGSCSREFYKRMRLSLIVAAVILVVQFIAVVLDAGSKQFKIERLGTTFVDLILVIVVILLVFNFISFLYMRLKGQVQSLSEEYYIIKGRITDKYAGVKIGCESKDRKKNYILFTCDQGNCYTPIEISKYQFKRISIGENVVIIKTESFDKKEIDYMREKDFN